MDNATGSDRQQHHVGLHNAIIGLRDASNGLNHLSATISDEPVNESSPDPKEDRPSLEIVLAGAGDRIRDISQRIETLTEEIRAKLF